MTVVAIAILQPFRYRSMNWHSIERTAVLARAATFAGRTAEDAGWYHS